MSKNTFLFNLFLLGGSFFYNLLKNRRTFHITKEDLNFRNRDFEWNKEWLEKAAGQDSKLCRTASCIGER